MSYGEGTRVGKGKDLNLKHLMHCTSTGFSTFVYFLCEINESIIYLSWYFKFYFACIECNLIIGFYLLFLTFIPNSLCVYVYTHMHIT